MICKFFFTLRTNRPSNKDKAQPNEELLKEVEEDDYARFLNMDGKMEDVRESNMVFSQTRIQKFMTFYYAIIGVGSSIVASEINMYYNEEDRNEFWVKFMIAVCNVSTIFMSKFSIIVMVM